MAELNKHILHPLDKHARKGGVAVVTIASNVGQGPDVEYKRAWLIAAVGNTGTIQFKYDTAAAATDYPILKTIEHPVAAYGNLNELFFYGGTNGDKIHIRYEV